MIIILGVLLSCVLGIVASPSLYSQEQMVLGPKGGPPKQLISHDVDTLQVTLDDYSLRVTNPDPSLCDPTVKKHTGFLDISHSKHLFFWFFESRKAPEKAPLTLWLNGGPGGSSAIGLFTELGPCNIAKNGNGTIYNPSSWTSYSNMIFLDQPINVGFSYADGDEEVGTSTVAAKDVYAFLQLFLAKFPEYASSPFHLAGESYAGTYIPHIASVIHRQNKALSDLTHIAGNNGDGRLNINLASVILANGHTDPLTQLASIPEYVCNGPYALLDNGSERCANWRNKAQVCQRLVQNCYDFDTPLVCAPATYYCMSEVWNPILDFGRDPYDIRKTCEPINDTVFCYEEIFWIQDWLNRTSTKEAIGIDPMRPFVMASESVGGAFDKAGDPARNSAKLLPELINNGIRLLVYVGMTDMACNFIGNEAWLTQLDNKFHDEFANSTFLPWVTIDSRKHAGEVRYAGGDGVTAGNVTFVKIYEAGHLAPYNQPEATLDLFARWILNIPLYLDNSTRIVSVSETIDSAR